MYVMEVNKVKNQASPALTAGGFDCWSFQCGGSVVVDSLFIVAPIVYGGLCLVLILKCSTKCLF